MNAIRSIIPCLLICQCSSLCFANECTENANCPQDSYCAKAPGDCDGLGEFQPRPEMCITLWNPVCGCDGKTYTNDCYAAMAGVNVTHVGECKPGPCKDNIGCPDGSYCAKEPGNCDGEGQCQPRPDACIDLWDPVCGCDGRTYGNACEAAAAGVNISHEGECPTGTCEDNSGCSDDSYCAKAGGDCDGPGECQPRPEICITLWDPVCGCDGKTYSNSCVAAAAGISVNYAGECAKCTRPEADLSGDCKVNMIDLAIMASQWLDCGWDRPELCL